MTKFIAKKDPLQNIKTEDTSLKDEESLEMNVPEYVTARKRHWQMLAFMEDYAEMNFKKELLKFYKTSTQHLMEHTPQKKFFQYA